jgi:hypothetical protein
MFSFDMPTSLLRAILKCFETNGMAFLTIFDTLLKLRIPHKTFLFRNRDSRSNMFFVDGVQSSFFDSGFHAEDLFAKKREKLDDFLKEGTASSF